MYYRNSTFFSPSSHSHSHSPSPSLAVALWGFGPLGIDVEKQGVRTAWLITGQKSQELGLKLKALILTFRDLSCQKIMRVAGWTDLEWESCSRIWDFSKSCCLMEFETVGGLKPFFFCGKFETLWGRHFSKILNFQNEVFCPFRMSSC